MKPLFSLILLSLAACAPYPTQNPNAKNWKHWGLAGVAMEERETVPPKPIPVGGGGYGALEQLNDNLEQLNLNLTLNNF